MLGLSRRVGERICIGDEIVVTVLDVTGSRIRLGVEAPSDVPIDRQEIWDRKAAEAEASRSEHQNWQLPDLVRRDTASCLIQTKS